MNNIEDFNKKRNRFKKIVVGMIAGITLLIVSIYASLAYFAVSEISDNGGVKNTIVKYGKEIKDISNLIQEEK